MPGPLPLHSRYLVDWRLVGHPRERLHPTEVFRPAVPGEAFAWVGLERGVHGVRFVHRFAERIAERERDAAPFRPAPAGVARLRIDVRADGRCRFLAALPEAEGEAAPWIRSGFECAATPWRWVGAQPALFAVAPGAAGGTGETDGGDGQDGRRAERGPGRATSRTRSTRQAGQAVTAGTRATTETRTRTEARTGRPPDTASSAASASPAPLPDPTRPAP